MQRITRDVIENYLDCRYKAYLKLAGHEGFTRDDPRQILDVDSRLPLTSVGNARPVHIKDQAAKFVDLTPSFLSKGASRILDGVFQTDLISLHVEGLQRAAGSSTIGNFHYLPFVFQSDAVAPKSQKVLLDVYAFILSHLQGRVPDTGIILKGEGKSKAVRLSPGHKSGERILNTLKELQQADQPPALMLNKHCQICEFQSRCHAQAVEEGNLSLLGGMSEAEMARLRGKGIFTINQLSYTFRPRRVKKRAKTPAHPHYFALQARALREARVFVHGNPKLNAKDVRIYMDLEGTPTKQSYYLIGLLVAQDGSVHQKSFWSDRDDGESEIFMEMLDYIKPFQDYSVLHYGAYEVRALRRIQRKLPSDYANHLGDVLKRTINVLSVIGPHIYFPVFSNSLKEIAGFLGHKWSSANATGVQALLWRRRWDETQNEQIRDELVRYNMEDCIGLKVVSDFIELISLHDSAAPNASLPYFHTDHFEKEGGQRGIFQKQNFVLEEFDFINRCSYFDYQRDRMSARHVRRLSQDALQTEKSTRKTYKNNKVSEIFVSRCPICRSRKLSSMRSLKRQIIDLKFSGAAVRRWVVLYISQKYRCQKCKKEFTPDGFPTTRTKFGKGLLSWCMYQMIVGGQNMLRIRGGLARMFGIELEVPSIYNFKQSISLHYAHLYDEMSRTIMNSPVLYIDETTANLRSETGYVWCITDGRSVLYFYRDSREGSFLEEMFKDFRGVLVSDFYTAYDSLKCQQQRCLVHLMRDFNEEMQKHPFDNELKLVGVKFSEVLRDSVATIDQYGFKARHLTKHKRAANDFCRWASNCEFGSPSAERLRSRIAKYQDQLFTFLGQDGVSWNNTIAEHFIKPFARYRQTANGKFTARSIRDYLVILSIAETCKGRGEDFLEFLLRDNERSFRFAGRASARAASEADPLVHRGQDEP
jgi:predicted RecB family nuclease